MKDRKELERGVGEGGQGGIEGDREGQGGKGRVREGYGGTGRNREEQ